METKCHCPHCHKPLEVLLDINIVATGKLPLPPPPVPEFLTVPPIQPLRSKRYSNEQIYQAADEYGIRYVRPYTKLRKNGLRRTKLYFVRGTPSQFNDAVNNLGARFPNATIHSIAGPMGTRSIELIFSPKE